MKRGSRLSLWRFLLLLCLVAGLFFGSVLLGYSQDRTELLSELKAISRQFQTALDEAEKALDDLSAALAISETAQSQSKAELSGLKAEHQSLRLEVQSLREASGRSETQRAEAERQLSSVEQRIGDLRTSLEDYKRKVAREVRRKKTWRTVAIVEFLALAGAVFAIAK